MNSMNYKDLCNINRRLYQNLEYLIEERSELHCIYHESEYNAVVSKMETVRLQIESNLDIMFGKNNEGISVIRAAYRRPDRASYSKMVREYKANPNIPLKNLAAKYRMSQNNVSAVITRYLCAKYA